MESPTDGLASPLLSFLPKFRKKGLRILDNKSVAVAGKQRKRGSAKFSAIHIAQMTISTVLLIAAAGVMVGGGYLLGGAFLVVGTVLGLIDLESD